VTTTSHSSGAAAHGAPDPLTLYRLLVEQVEDYAIFALDTSGHVITWNPGVQRLKGYTAAEIIGQHFSRFYTPEDVASGLPQRLLDLAARTGRAGSEGWRVRKDGSRFWALVSITALHDEQGRLTAFAKITRDLTQRRESEIRARQLAAEEAAHAATTEKARELEKLNKRLNEQRAELESQTEEAQSLAEELEQANESLQSALVEAEEARDAANAAEGFVRATLDNIADPFVVFDAGWRYQYVNPAAARLMDPDLEPDPTRHLGEVIWDIYPALRGTDFESNLREAAARRTVDAFDTHHVARGAWSAVQVYPLPAGGVAVQWRDITALKRANQAGRFLVRASEILGSSLDYKETLNEVARLVVPELADWCAVEIADDDGKLEQLAVAHVDPEKTRWGRELNRRYPSRPEDPTGAYNVLRTGRPELYSDISDEMLVRSAIDAEHLAVSRSLGIRSVILVPLGARGRVVGVLTLITSESHRRYDEQDLQLAMELAHRAAIAVDNARLHADALRAREDAEHAREEAERANRAKTDFLATMSHELRTPLNAISGYTDLLKLGVKGSLNDAQTDYVGRIERSGRYLLSLIQDVLSFAKLESGRVEIRTTDVPINGLLEELSNLIQPQVAAAGLRLTDPSCERDIVVRGDAERVRQILLNLLGNAVKFTPPGGTISLGCEADDTTVQVTVSDTGPGIPPDKLEEIFKPFVQLQREGVGSQAGTGLGLAISRDLARAMNGDLLVRSHEQQGSQFVVVLPRAR
jgi:PAS domain S-box-containing protein